MARAGKRAPQGATSLKVLDVLVRLHTKNGNRVPVSRSDLRRSLKSMPETTLDDRLRTLRVQKRVVRVGRALYEPVPWKGDEPVPYGAMKLVLNSKGEREWRMSQEFKKKLAKK